MKIIRPPNQPVERILLIGMDGTGKTWDTFSWINAMPDDSRVFYMDSDDTVPRFLASEEFSHLSDRVIREDAKTYGWDPYKATLKRWRKEATSNDIVVIDRASEPWDLAQEYVIESLFGMDHEEFIMQQKLAAKSGDKDAKAEFFKDNIWQFIKPQYKVFVKFVMQCPANIILLTSEKPLTYMDEGNAETMKMWSSVGAKAEGEKHLANIVHSLGRKTKRVAGRDTTWHLSMKKDRQRELADIKVTNFAMDYLVQYAGWDFA